MMKKTLLFFGILIIASNIALGQMCQPKVDTTTGKTMGSGGLTPYPTFLGWNHKVSGTARLLVVQVAGDAHADSVKYAGVQLTRLDSADTLSGSVKIKAEMWYQLNPPAGSDSVKVYFAPGSGTFNGAKHAQATSFTNVNQSTPFGTSVKYKYNTACPASLLVRSDTNSLVLDMFVDAKWQYPPTKGALQTKLFSKTIGTTTSAAGSVQPGADSVYMDWTWTFCGSIPLVSIAVPIKGLACLTGINEIKDGIVNLFPNPVSNTLHYQLRIKENTGFHVEVVDITGKILLSEKTKVNLGDNNLEVNVSTLTPGIYFLKLLNAKGEYSTARFIKTE